MRGVYPAPRSAPTLDARRRRLAMAARMPRVPSPGSGGRSRMADHSSVRTDSMAFFVVTERMARWMILSNGARLNLTCWSATHAHNGFCGGDDGIEAGPAVAAARQTWRRTDLMAAATFYYVQKHFNRSKEGGSFGRNRSIYKTCLFLLIEIILQTLLLFHRRIPKICYTRAWGRPKFTETWQTKRGLAAGDLAPPRGRLTRRVAGLGRHRHDGRLRMRRATLCATREPT